MAYSMAGDHRWISPDQPQSRRKTRQVTRLPRPSPKTGPTGEPGKSGPVSGCFPRFPPLSSSSAVPIRRGGSRRPKAPHRTHYDPCPACVHGLFGTPCHREHPEGVDPCIGRRACCLPAGLRGNRQSPGTGGRDVTRDRRMQDGHEEERRGNGRGEPRVSCDRCCHR